MKIVGSLICVVALASLPISAQDYDRANFSAGARLVLIPVTVTDRHNAFVDGLPRDAFTVSEDGVAQQIRSFSEEDAPVSVGVVLDLSGSMARSVNAAKEALLRFAALANPEDEAFLDTVSSRPREWAGFNGGFDELVSKVAFEGARGSTALIDTVWLSLTRIHGASNTRKALLVISDGMDNHSRHSERELLERAAEADVQIYTLTVFDTPPVLKADNLAEQQHGLILMHDLAARTGGLEYIVRDRTQLDSAVEGISHALRNVYYLGYVPANRDSSGKWRRIQVRVTRNGLRAHARTGYRPE